MSDASYSRTTEIYLALCLVSDCPIVHPDVPVHMHMRNGPPSAPIALRCNFSPLEGDGLLLYTVLKKPTLHDIPHPCCVSGAQQLNALIR